MPEPRFLLDADMPRSSAEVVRKHGFDVKDVRDIGMGNAKDGEIMECARSEGRVVITRDREFGNTLRYPKHPGVVILRLPYTHTSSEINERLDRFLSAVDAEKLPGAVTVVEVKRFRRRKIQE
jgi:predicted nuclease of predicted toxin-antitoxin system